MISFIRTVDRALCLYIFGRAFSHDNWVAGQQVRIVLNDQGDIVRPLDTYETYLNQPRLRADRIRVHLENRLWLAGDHECSVIDNFDRDGFEPRKPRVVRVDFNHVETKPAPAAHPQNQSTATSGRQAPPAARLSDKPATVRKDLVLLLKEIGPTKPFQAEAFAAAVPEHLLGLIALLLAELCLQHTRQYAAMPPQLPEQLTASLAQMGDLIQQLKGVWSDQTGRDEAPEAPQPPPAA